MRVNMYRCDLCKKEHKQEESANMRFLTSAKPLNKVISEDICRDCEKQILQLIDKLSLQ